jgi:hypothetical protein
MEESNKKKYVYPKEKIQEYNKRFLDKYKDIKIECEVCLKEYNYFAKSHHLNSKFHLNSIKVIEKTLRDFSDSFEKINNENQDSIFCENSTK